MESTAPQTIAKSPAGLWHSRSAHLVLVGALWLLLYGSALLTPPLLDDADSVHAEVAREMLLRHDPVTLYVNGIRYLEKAPLLYWSMAASFRLFGVSTAAARLPLALYTLALFLAVYALGRQLFSDRAHFHSAGANRQAAFYAALVLLASPGLYLFTRILIPDALVCLWTTLAMLAFARSLRLPTRLSAAAFAAASALNILSKGLIGVVFPLTIVVLYLLLTRNLGHLRRWHPWLALLVFVVLAAPWHIAAGLANPTEGHPVGLTPTPGNIRGFFWFYFVNEHLLRYLNQRVPRDYDTVPLALFWGLVLLWLAPWSVYLGAAFRRVPFVRALRREPLGSEAAALLFLALWAAVPLVFFSFSTRQEYYVLPSLPPLALLLGRCLASHQPNACPNAASQAAQHPARAPALVLCAIAWPVALLALALALLAHTPEPGAQLSAALHQNPGDYALSLGHLLDLSTAAMAFFRPELVVVGVALLAGTGLHLWFRSRRRAQPAVAALVSMMLACLLAAHRALVTFTPVLSSARLAAVIRPQLGPDDLVVINGEFESASTLSFYLARPLSRPLHILNGRSSNLWYGSFFRDSPAIFETDVSLQRLWSGPQRIFLWTEAGHPPSQLPGPTYRIAASEGKEILSNRR